MCERQRALGRTFGRWAIDRPQVGASIKGRDHCEPASVVNVRLGSRGERLGLSIFGPVNFRNRANRPNTAGVREVPIRGCPRAHSGQQGSTGNGRHANTRPAHDLAAYVADYEHPARGVMSIKEQDGDLYWSWRGMSPMQGRRFRTAELGGDSGDAAVDEVIFHQPKRHVRGQRVED